MLRTLLQQGDLANAVNGGAVLVQSSIEQENNDIIIRFNAPSLSADLFDIILNNNELIVSCLYKGVNENNGFAFPISLQRFALPADASMDKIEAEYRNNQLSITIPVQQAAGVHNIRKIKIRH